MSLRGIKMSFLGGLGPLLFGGPLPPPKPFPGGAASFPIEVNLEDLLDLPSLFSLHSPLF